jgi:Kef-type K+ transport system membrane component KefB
MALSFIGLFGKVLLNPLFDLVAGSGCQESFIGMIPTVLGMSFLTEGLGLSNTLGAVLSGMSIAEMKHRHHVEVEALPFRVLLVGLIFFTVGKEVAFRTGRSAGILCPETTKMMLTCVRLTMALTLLLEDLGSKTALKLEASEEKKIK